MRTRLKGVARATKKLADGTRRTYFYAWRGGPLLKGKDGEPLQDPTAPEFLVAFTDAHRERLARADGNMGSLVQLFRESPEFTGKKDRTREEYRRYLDLIDAKFGTMPLAAIDDIRARGKFKAWRDTMAGTPRKADYAWSVLARVLSVAKDRGKLTNNVCERGGRIYKSDRTENVWDADQIKAMVSVASHPLRVALMLALWTGQRQGDLLGLQWSAYDGSSIRMQQGKTGARVKIPVSGLLKEVLDEEQAKFMSSADDPKKVKYLNILKNTRGERWTSDGFKTSWGKAAKKAGVVERTFHDLRGTAVTRLALAGCEVTEIASITGHSIKDAASILDAHYLGGRFELAEQAMTKLVAHQNRKTP